MYPKLDKLVRFFNEEEGTTPVEIAVLLTLCAVICLAAMATIS